MKKAIAIIVAVLFVFALTSISFAAEEKKAAPAPAEKKAEPAKPAEKKPAVKVRLTGEVKAVDAVAKTITVAKKVKEKVEETVVTVDDKTKITLGKEKKTLVDVKVGDKVTVKYQVVDGKNVAKSVAIKPPAKPAEKK
ncbi:MAG: hypothetical protein ACOYU0_04585 [Nitrospirota bacterium]